MHGGVRECAPCTRLGVRACMGNVHACVRAWPLQTHGMRAMGVQVRLHAIRVLCGCPVSTSWT